MDHTKYQTGPKRIAAAVVDRMIFMPLLLVEQWLYHHAPDAALFFGWLFLTAVLHLVYAVVLHQKFGYTFGKWLVGVKVLDLTESRTLNYAEAIRRESVYFLIEMTGILIFFYLMIHSGDDGNLYDRYRNLVRNVGLIWVWLILLSMLSNPKRRSIHDFLGRSVVVRG